MNAPISCPTKRRRSGPAPTDRRAEVEHALELYTFMERHSPLEWPDTQSLRGIARDLGVPYLMLLVILYTSLDPPVVTLADLDALDADPTARVVLGEWLAARDREEVA